MMIGMKLVHCPSKVPSQLYLILDIKDGFSHNRILLRNQLQFSKVLAFHFKYIFRNQDTLLLILKFLAHFLFETNSYDLNLNHYQYHEKI